MIAVIFGGHGFIGSHLARELASSGRYSRVVSADIAPSPRFTSPSVEYLYCDVRQPIPENFPPEATEIYNLAAIHVTPGHPDSEYFWTNISGAQNITEYARKIGVETLFFTSSISVYGPGEAEASETSPLRPESAYGQSKLLAEQIHCQWQRESATKRRLVIVRPAVIFGYQEQGNFTRLARQLERRAFIYPGRKDTVKACGYVKDLIASLQFASSQNERLLVYNFAFGEKLTIEDICDSFCDIARFQRPRWVIPIGVVMLAGLMFEYLGKIGIRTGINRARVLKLFRSTNVIPGKLEAIGFVRRFDLKEALRDWQTHSPSGRFE
jgi:nucleoside-diphosphate-sugar epimerase